MSKRYTIKPTGDRVFVAYEAPPSEKGGIVLPDRNVDRPDTGTVAARGPQADDLEVGDIVLMPRVGGQKVTIDGTPYFVFCAKDILCALG